MTRMLSTGMTGDDVKMLQAVLNYHRDPILDEVLAVDGIFGNRTKDRVKSFQAKNQLDPDGIVGPKTRQELMTICRFTAEYVVSVDPPPVAQPVGPATSPVTVHYELTNGVKRTLSPWNPPPTKLQYVLEFEAAWVIKNPGLPAPFSLALGAELGRTMTAHSPDGPYIYSGAGRVMGKFEKDVELGPIKLDSSFQAGFEAEHEISSPHVDLSAKASLASGISFAVVRNRFYLFTQGELGAAVDWSAGTVQSSVQWDGTAGFKLTF